MTALLHRQLKKPTQLELPGFPATYVDKKTATLKTYLVSCNCKATRYSISQLLEAPASKFRTDKINQLVTDINSGITELLNISNKLLVSGKIKSVNPEAIRSAVIKHEALKILPEIITHMSGNNELVNLVRQTAINMKDVLEPISDAIKINSTGITENHNNNLFIARLTYKLRNLSNVSINRIFNSTEFKDVVEHPKFKSLDTDEKQMFVLAMISQEAKPENQIQIFKITKELLDMNHPTFKGDSVYLAIKELSKFQIIPMFFLTRAESCDNLLTLIKQSQENNHISWITHQDSQGLTEYLRRQSEGARLLAESISKTD